MPLLATIEDLQQASVSASAETPRIAESPSVRIAQAQAKAQGQTQGPSSVQLVVRSIEEYRLVWDTEGERRYAIDVKYLANRHDAVVFSDASPAVLGHANEAGTEDEADASCGRLSPVKGWREGLVQRIWQGLRDDGAGQGQDAGCPEAGADGNKPKDSEGEALVPPAAPPKPARQPGKPVERRLPPACMDGGASLLVPVDMLEVALQRVVREVEAAIAADPGTTTVGKAADGVSGHGAGK